VRNLTGALVQQLLPADEVKHNPMKTRESAETAAAATPDRPTSLPKANQKAKRNVQITEEATFWLQACESVSSLCLFICLFQGKKGTTTVWHTRRWDATISKRHQIRKP
jgi:hypothetical protein